MAVITSYSTLLTAVSDYLNRSDLTTFIPNWVQNWEERFYRDPKNFGRWMETSADSVIASDVVARVYKWVGKYRQIRVRQNGATAATATLMCGSTS